MVIYFNLDANGRLDGWSSNSTRQPNEIMMEVSDDHEVLSNARIFKYENGELIKDTAYQKELKAEIEQEQNKPSDEEMNAIAIMELSQMVMGGK